MSHRLHALRLISVTIAVSLIIVACAAEVHVLTSPSPPSALPVPIAVLEATAAPVPTVAPTPPPTFAPIAATTHIQLAPHTEPEVHAIAGLDLSFKLSGFQALEKFTVTYAGPDGQGVVVGPGRANMLGEAEWVKSTSHDLLGRWTVIVDGGAASQAVGLWALRPLDLQPQSTISLGTEFKIYHTPEARLHFDDSLFESWVAIIAQHLAESDGLIESTLGKSLGTIDVFLLPDNEALQRELVAAGSTPSSGFEAGIALIGGARPGIYIDMEAPPYSWHHVIAHEFVHQVIGAIEQGRPAPLWFVEGLAEYLGHRAALGSVGDFEHQWARITRENGRRGAEPESWIDLRGLGPYEPWNSERNLKRLEQMYGQSFAAAEYIANTYGLAAFGPLLRAIIESPDDLDAPFLQILGVNFDEFQASARSFLLEPTDFEEEMDALLEYTRTAFDLANRDAEASSDWRAFLSQRASLTTQQRVTSLSEFREVYVQLKTKAAGLHPPERLADVHSILEATYPLYISAMDTFIRLEQELDTTLLAQGNADLKDAILHIEAVEDLLMSELAALGLGEEDVFGQVAA